MGLNICNGGRDRTGRDGTERNGTGRNGTGRHGTARNGTGRDGTAVAERGRARVRAPEFKHSIVWGLILVMGLKTCNEAKMVPRWRQYDHQEYCV